MRLYGVRIFVDDFAKARTFYGETLGLPVAWEMEELDAVGYKVGEAQLIVEKASGAEADHVGRFTGISLAVDDIAAIHRELEAKGVTFRGAPEAQEWGGTTAHFEDPAGNVLTLMS